jgi:hypothetical protein
MGPGREDEMLAIQEGQIAETALHRYRLIYVADQRGDNPTLIYEARPLAELVTGASSGTQLASETAVICVDDPTSEACERVRVAVYTKLGLG